MTAAFRGSSKPASTFAQRWSLREVGWVFFWSLQIAQIASPSYRSVYIYMPYKYIQYIDMNEIQSESHSKKTWRSSYHNLEIYLVFSQTFSQAHPWNKNTRSTDAIYIPSKNKILLQKPFFFWWVGGGEKKIACVLGEIWLVVWGPVVWIPAIPLWKGLLLEGTPIESQTTGPQSIKSPISWLFLGVRKISPGDMAAVFFHQITWGSVADRLAKISTDGSPEV